MAQKRWNMAADPFSGTLCVRDFVMGLIGKKVLLLLYKLMGSKVHSVFWKVVIFRWKLKTMFFFEITRIENLFKMKASYLLVFLRISATSFFLLEILLYNEMEIFCPCKHDFWNYWKKNGFGNRFSRDILKTQ